MTRPLVINLVPKTIWGKSLAHFLPNWNEVRTKVCSCGCCAICDTNTKQLQAHEVWKYNDDDHTVDLKDIIPVCENCHLALHYGKARVDGKEKQALAWYRKVNGLSNEIARHEIKMAFDWWSIRSACSWTFNDGILDKIEEITGISCKMETVPGRVYLRVPFAEKDSAKALGAWWDKERKLWYVPDKLYNEHPEYFSGWVAGQNLIDKLNDTEYRWRG